MSDMGAPDTPAPARGDRMRLTLALLTWNEIDGCRHDIPLLPLHAFDEVYAVDGGSTDGTVEYLVSQGITVHRQPVRGYNQANICAFDKCTTEAVILFHPKGGIDPASLLNFRPLLEQGYDLVVASRIAKGAHNEEDDRLFRPRKWFVKCLAAVCAVLWCRKGKVVWDILHGMRAMRRDSFIAIKPLQSGLSIDMEMVVRGYRLGFKAVEFPIIERPRIAGRDTFQGVTDRMARARLYFRRIAPAALTAPPPRSRQAVGKPGRYFQS